MTATAPALEPDPSKIVQMSPGASALHLAPLQATPAPARPAPAYQPSLFRGDPALRPKVVPIPVLVPRSQPVRPPKSTKNSKPRIKDSTAQQSLAFPAIHEPVKPPQFESVIYCDAPVAIPVQRVVASLVDGAAWFLTSFALLIGFHYLGGEIALTKTGVLCMAGLFLAVCLMYRLAWGVMELETPGMRFVGLKLVDFDGRALTRDQRISRQGAYALSLLSVGLGLVWALVDEENLTWHDHISKSFPTTV